MRFSAYLALLGMVMSVKASALSKREVLAREAAMATLPEHIQQELARRDPSEYDLDLTPFLARDTHPLDKRGAATGPGLTNCVSGNDISMTYDDGPYQWEKELTDEYADAGMKITYFVNVNNWDCAYDSPFAENLQYAVSKGMIVGSHSATHPDFTTLTIPEIDEQIQIVENFTWTTLGLLPRFFRPPYGATNQKINDHLNSKWGLTVVTWSTDSGDADNATPEQSIATIKATTGGEIVLNHETHQTSVEQVAPAVISDLKSKQRKSISVDECVNVKPYKARLRNNAPQRTDKWNCNGLPAPGKSNV